MAEIVFLCLTGAICVFWAMLAMIFYFRVCRQLRRHRAEIDDLTTRLQQAESRVKHEDTRKGGGLTEKQLESRFETREYGRFVVSSKYRYVSQLIRSGLGVSDIAEILEVSRNEAEQMIELADSRKESA
ncbi:MAG: hypothetical protein K9J79_02700 [Desulfobacteraceae bacterium]|nr:hypothetical protein [Desulfobacteraceae bacterium]MCF8094251.1 hypothetical protein [Desulfobacteraceae bacterium]